MHKLDPYSIDEFFTAFDFVVMKLYRGDNEGKQSNTCKFAWSLLTLTNSPLYICGETNRSRVFGGLWLVAPSVYRGKFLKVSGQQPINQRNYCNLWFLSKQYLLYSSYNTNYDMYLCINCNFPTTVRNGTCSLRSVKSKISNVVWCYIKLLKETINNNGYSMPFAFY